MFLSVHLTVSVGWIGAVFAYLVLGLAAVNGNDATTRSAWVAMEVVGWYAIVPLAVTSLLTGVVMALGTRWGLFRYYWVVVSFTLTVLATVVLVVHMPTVSHTAQMAREADGRALDLLGGDLAHPAIGLVILVFVQWLNMFKPPGLTRYGWRKQQGRSTPADAI